jgi:hypothetical protein
LVRVVKESIDHRTFAYPLSEAFLSDSVKIFITALHQEYIRSLGHPVPFPSLCKFCPFKSDLDLYYQWRFERPDYERWVELERAKLDAHAERSPHLPPERNHGVFPGRTLPEVLSDARRKYAHMTDAELHDHRMNHGHGVASKY